MRWTQYEAELDASFHRLEEVFLAVDSSHIKSNSNDSSSNINNILYDDDSSSNDSIILRQALELFYLFTTFAPLSRGTATCGYAGFCAVLLSYGRRVRRAASTDGNNKQLSKNDNNSTSGELLSTVIAKNDTVGSSEITNHNTATAAKPQHQYYLLPTGKQLDWEAILAVDFEAFYNKVHQWFVLEKEDIAIIGASNGGCSQSDEQGATSPTTTAMRRMLTLQNEQRDVTAASTPISVGTLFNYLKTSRDILDILALPYTDTSC